MKRDKRLMWWGVAAGAFGATYLTVYHRMHRTVQESSTEQQLQLTRTDIEELAYSGYRKILSVILARAIYRSFGVQARVRGWKELFSIAAVSLWPLPLNVILQHIWPAASIFASHAWLALAASTGANVVMLGAAWGAWNLFTTTTPSIDSVIRLSPEREDLAIWLESRLEIWRQIAIIVAGVPITVWITYTANGFTEISLISYVSGIWTGAIGANVLYWLYTMGQFVRRLFRSGQLSLYWYDPARTPAVVKICSAYMFVGLALLIGTISVELFAVLIPAKTGSETLTALAIGFPIFATFTALYVVVQPYVTIYLTVRRAKLATLDRVSIHILGQTVDLFNAERLDALIGMHREFRDMSSLPISAVNVVQYVAVVVGTLFAYLLQRFA